MMVVVVVGLSRLDFHRFFSTPTHAKIAPIIACIFNRRAMSKKRSAGILPSRHLVANGQPFVSLSLFLLSHVLWINRATTDSNIKRCLVFKLANKVCGNYLLLSSFCFLFFPIHLIPPLRYLLSSSPFPRLSHTIGDRRRPPFSPARSFEILIRS